ncbi:MAG: sulfite reductase subunit alpha [Verrucomicrobiota bacterium]
MSDTPVFDRKNPFSAKVTTNFCLNKEGSAKNTRHIEVSIEGSGLEYAVGASLGVYPRNPPSVVADLVGLLQLDGEQKITDKKTGEEKTLYHILSHEVALNRATKKFVSAYAEKMAPGDARDKLAGLAENKEQLDVYLWDRDFVDVIKEYGPISITGEELVALFPKANPRLYSIASSPTEFPADVHLTVAVVEYETHGRTKLGLCSGFLGYHVENGVTEVPVYVQPSKHFHLPEDPNTNIIMVGPGTGIAPFRAFLQERRAKGEKGQNWLFFGDQHAATDYLYEDDFKEFQEQGYLHKVDLAFSRDQAEKVYVQDKMRENGAELWRWISEGAYFYVCGDAKRMAKDVNQALIDIAAEHGGMPIEEAEEWVNKKFAREEKRYLKDVY